MDAANVTADNNSMLSLPSDLDYTAENETEEYIIVVGTSLRRNKNYYTVYMIYMNLALNGLAPLLSLVLLNSRIYMRLRCTVAYPSNSI
jgi:hypothetical protein